MEIDWGDISGSDAIKVLEMIFEASLDLETTAEPQVFLNKLLTHSRRIVGANAGSLYLIKEDKLAFLACQNDEIDVSSILGSKGGLGSTLPLGTSSIAGYVASTGTQVHIPNAYDIPSTEPYTFNPSVDKQTGFKTRCILAVPLIHPEDGVIGTLELINPEKGAVSKMRLGLVKSFSVMAAVSITNMKLRDNLNQAYMETLFRLGVASEYKDEDTYEHIQRIRYSSRLIAREMGFNTEKQENIFHASAMHDLGKIGVSDLIIRKPGRLTDGEMDVMRTHPEIGNHILSGSKTEILQLSARIALCHHEKWNGSGYPKGLVGEDIPVEARIVAIADVFDALVNARPYKKAWPMQKALDLLIEEKGQHFDPAVVDAFFVALPEIKKVQRKYGTLIDSDSKDLHAAAIL